MAQVAVRISGIVIKSTITATLLALVGCTETPTVQTIAGLPASGTVSISEDFVVGWGGGTGVLNYQGQAYPFNFVCTILGPGGGGLSEVDRVVGPGGGLSKIIAAGEVYKLANVGEFSGRYTQSTSASEVWLQNSSGVIMHLRGTRTGATELIPVLDEVSIEISSER